MPSNESNSSVEQSGSSLSANAWYLILATGIIVLLFLLARPYVMPNETVIDVETGDSTGVDTTVAERGDSTSTSSSDSSRVQAQTNTDRDKSPTASSGRTGSSSSYSSNGGRHSSDRREKSRRQGTSSSSSSSTQSVETIESVDTYVPKEERIEGFIRDLSSSLSDLDNEIMKNKEEVEEAVNSIDDPIRRSDTAVNISIGIARMDRFDDEILDAANEEGIDPLLLKTIVRVESNFNPSARASSTTAAGLTQVVAPTYRLVHGQNNLSSETTEDRLMDPDHSLETAAKYLDRWVIPNSTNMRMIFFNYYIGHNAIKCLVEQGGISCFPKGKIDNASRYANKCMSIYKKWKGEVGYEYKSREV